MNREAVGRLFANVRRDAALLHQLDLRSVLALRLAALDASRARQRADGLSRPHCQNHRAVSRRRHCRCRCRGWSQTGCRANGASRSSSRTAPALPATSAPKPVYRADPDGYTLLSAPPPPLVINQNLYPKLGFDPTKFEPIIVMAQVPNALIVNPDKIKASKPDRVRSIILQKNPGKITSATQGNGTTSHLTSELFPLMAKVKLHHIPYRGLGAGAAGPARRRRRFDVRQSRRLAAAGPGRQAQIACGCLARNVLPALPNVPTIAETAARVRSGRLVWHRGAAEHAEGYRREDQCRRERSPASAGDA